MLLDPLAGNSIITGLNVSVKQDAKDQIDIALAESIRLRSRMRRKRELAGEKEMNKDENDF